MQLQPVRCNWREFNATCSSLGPQCNVTGYIVALSCALQAGNRVCHWSIVQYVNCNPMYCVEMPILCSARTLQAGHRVCHRSILQYVNCNATYCVEMLFPCTGRTLQAGNRVCHQLTREVCNVMQHVKCVQAHCKLVLESVTRALCNM